MKVLLLDNVRSLGKKHEVVTVPDGFANNNLIPRKLAIPANSPQAKQIVTKAGEKASAKAHGTEKTQELLSSIDKLSVTGNANDKGVLYKSISADDVSKLLKKEHHIDVPAKAIQVPHGGHLKEAGEHQITITLGGKTTTHTLEITA